METLSEKLGGLGRIVTVDVSDSKYKSFLKDIVGAAFTLDERRCLYGAPLQTSWHVAHDHFSFPSNTSRVMSVLRPHHVAIP